VVPQIPCSFSHELRARYDPESLGTWNRSPRERDHDRIMRLRFSEMRDFQFFVFHHRGRAWCVVSVSADRRLRNRKFGRFYYTLRNHQCARRVVGDPPLASSAFGSVPFLAGDASRPLVFSSFCSFSFFFFFFFFFFFPVPLALPNNRRDGECDEGRTRSRLPFSSAFFDPRPPSPTQLCRLYLRCFFSLCLVSESALAEPLLSVRCDSKCFSIRDVRMEQQMDRRMMSFFFLLSFLFSRKRRIKFEGVMRDLNLMRKSYHRSPKGEREREIRAVLSACSKNKRIAISVQASHARITIPSKFTRVFS